MTKISDSNLEEQQKAQMESTKKKSKFQTHLELSHKDIKGKRATMFFEDAKEDSAQHIRTLKTKKREFERKLMNLEDFHVSSTTSLEVTKDGFDSALWVKEMNNIQINLQLHGVKVNIAEKIHKDWFDKIVE